MASQGSNEPELQGEARFELKRQLADTLQGRIYSAIDRKTGEWVVVKETWKQLVKLGKSRDGHTVPENFEEEKRILKYLSNCKDADVGFVRLIDEWEDKDCFLYAMEMCRGGELFEYIKGMHTDGAVAHFTRTSARLKQEEMKEPNEWIKVVQNMFRQIVKCTAWMHSKGVCHLDMSLENSMIAARSKKYGNEVKIIDFGLAIYYPNHKFVNNKRVGKTGYMAPEVYLRKKYDPRAADIWSLGVMLFMMLIGAPPYQIPSKTNPAFNFIVNGRLRDVLKHWKRLRMVDKDSLDLMNQIFKIESQRITMSNILKHPFVNVPSKEPVESEAAAVKQSKEPVQNSQPQKPQKKPQQQPEQQPQPQPQPQQELQPAAARTTTTTTHTGKTTTIATYPFRSEIAKKFAAKISNDLPRDELTTIMKDVEQTHNSMQQKIRQQQQKINAKQNLPQTCKELQFIYNCVEKQLDRCSGAEEQQTNKKAALERHNIAQNN